MDRPLRPTQRARRALLAVLLAIPCALALGLPGAAAAEQRPQPRIIAGSNATQGEFPYQVYLEIGPSTCGGSILDATHIVTAAHCVVDESGFYPQVFSPSEVTMYHGGVDRPGLPDLPQPNATETRQVTAVSVDRRYLRNGRDFVYDSAVLTLDGALTLDANTAPIALATSTEVATAFSTPSNATITGWGGTFEGDPAGSEILQKAPVPLVTDSDCRNTYGAALVDPVMICAGRTSATPTEDTCQGDSGGPLALPGSSTGPRLAGITSFGNGCGRSPGVYTEVNETATRTLLEDIDQMAPPTATGPPTVSGTPRVGQRVTCNPRPGPGAVVTQYLWFEQSSTDTQQIPQSTQTITLPASSQGKVVFCDVRLERSESGFFYSEATQGIGPVAPAASSAPTPSPAPAPAVTPLPPRLADISFGGFPRRASLRSVLRDGLAGRVGCDADCSFRAELVLPRRSARKAGLRGRAVAVSRVRSSDAAGGSGRKIRFKFKRSIARKLRRLTRGTSMEVRVAAVDSRGTRRTEKRKLLLKR